MMHRYFIYALLVVPFALSPVCGGKFDIVVQDQAVVQRCVLDNSARNIAVGMPGGFNFAFDPVRCQLSYVWYGGFLDYRPEATGRGGGRVNVLGTKRGVGTGNPALRINDPDKQPESIRFHGYKKESATRVPTFLFEVDGVHVEQKVLSSVYDNVTIELRFADVDESNKFYHLDLTKVAAVEFSKGLRWSKPGIIEIPAGEKWAQLRVTLKPTKEKFVRPKPTTSGPMLYALHCMSCHTLDGTKRIGPSFANLWKQKRVVLRDGTADEIDASEQYIRESMLEPQAAVVQGYEQANQMIDIKKTLNEEQIEALVKYLVELKQHD